MARLERYERTFSLNLNKVPNSQKTLWYSNEQLPWLEKKEEPVEVSQYLAQGGRRFYYGHLIVGPLVEYAVELARKGRVWTSKVDNALSTRLPEFVEKNQQRNIHPLAEPKTKKNTKIWYIKQTSGHGAKEMKFRPYFMRDMMYSIVDSGKRIVVPQGRLADSHVIISIAECYKGDDEEEVIAILTNSRNAKFN